jgi:thiosulfate dehydrogenase (quinone) large subunit
VGVPHPGLRDRLYESGRRHGRVRLAFSYDADNGWITSGFSFSPTSGYVDGLDGPLAFIPENVPVGVADFGWMFAIGGLGIALTLGICSRIAGWGGFLLNVMIWFSVFPPANNPVFDAEHFMFAFILLLLMWIQASNYWGIGRWWRARTPAFLH